MLLAAIAVSFLVIIKFKVMAILCWKHRHSIYLGIRGFIYQIRTMWLWFTAGDTRYNAVKALKFKQQFHRKVMISRKPGLMNAKQWWETRKLTPKLTDLTVNTFGFSFKAKARAYALTDFKNDTFKEYFLELQPHIKDVTLENFKPGNSVCDLMIVLHKSKAPEVVAEKDPSMMVEMAD